MRSGAGSHNGAVFLRHNIHCPLARRFIVFFYRFLINLAFFFLMSSKTHCSSASVHACIHVNIYEFGNMHTSRSSIPLELATAELGSLLVHCCWRIVICSSCFLDAASFKTSAALRTNAYTRIHAYTHTRIHAYMHTCMHACMHTCIHAYMQRTWHMHTSNSSTIALLAASVPLLSMSSAIAVASAVETKPCLGSDRSPNLKACMHTCIRTRVHTRVHARMQQGPHVCA